MLLQCAHIQATYLERRWRRLIAQHDLRPEEVVHTQKQQLGTLPPLCHAESLLQAIIPPPTPWHRTWEAPPGAASTRELGRSVMKLPTFCMQARQSNFSAAQTAAGAPIQAICAWNPIKCRCSAHLARRAHVVVAQLARNSVLRRGACNTRLRRLIFARLRLERKIARGKHVLRVGVGACLKQPRIFAPHLLYPSRRRRGGRRQRHRQQHSGYTIRAPPSGGRAAPPGHLRTPSYSAALQPATVCNVCNVCSDIQSSQARRNAPAGDRPRRRSWTRRSLSSSVRMS